MNPNPFLGVFFHWLGGLASGSFYVPYRFVRRWSWETYWLAGGVFSWIIAPWVLGSLLTNDLLGSAPRGARQLPVLDVLLGRDVGTGRPDLRPDDALPGHVAGNGRGLGILRGLRNADAADLPRRVRAQGAGHASGQVILVGVASVWRGLPSPAWPACRRKREMPEEQKKASIKEFNFKKGLLVATFSGVMSRVVLLRAGRRRPDQAITIEHGTPVLWQGLPVLVVVLLGGFTTNFIWCVLLNIKNKTAYQYFSGTVRDHAPGRDEETIIETAIDAPSEEVVEHIPGAKSRACPRADAVELLLLRLAGTTWYFQFFFYTMGETQMGKYKFSSWTLHMASIIIFSTLWGIALREWKGSSRRTIALVTLGLAVLVGSTILVGYGNYLGTLPGTQP